MSKLVTDSKVLLDFLFDGTGPDEQRDKLESVNLVLVETWQHLCALSNDFADLVASKMK